MGFFKSKKDNDDPIKNVKVNKKTQYVSSNLIKGNLDKREVKDIRTTILIAEKVEYLTGRGCVVTGTIKNAAVFVGDNLFCSGISIMVSGIEQDGKDMKAAKIGDEVELIFKIPSGMIEKGDILEK